MNINLIDFDISIGRKKPRTMKGMGHSSPCPFCDVAHLTDIIETQGSIILLKNKYNVMSPADQLVLIETDQCSGDIPDYTPDHMKALISFGIRHWLTLLNSGKYQAVAFFKNFGPLSGGTLQHPHMQLVGFPDIDPSLMYDPEGFCGITVYQENGVELNASTRPRIGFSEFNIVLGENAYDNQQLSPGHLGLTPRQESITTLALLIQQTVSFIREYFDRPNFSYNIFFYMHEGKIRVKILPRFATSPLFVGYSIHLKPTNISTLAKMLRKQIKKLLII